MRSPLASWRKLPLPTPSRHQPSPPRHPLLPHGSSISSHGEDAPFPWLSSSCRYLTRRPSVAGRASSRLLLLESGCSREPFSLASLAQRRQAWSLAPLPCALPFSMESSRSSTSHGALFSQPCSSLLHADAPSLPLLVLPRATATGSSSSPAVHGAQQTGSSAPSPLTAGHSSAPSPLTAGHSSSSARPLPWRLHLPACPLPFFIPWPSYYAKHRHQLPWTVPRNSSRARPIFFPWPKVPPVASSAPKASSPGSELLPCIAVGRRCRCHYLAHSSRSELHRRHAQQAAHRSSMLLRLAR
jgi:hypothetical protein